MELACSAEHCSTLIQQMEHIRAKLLGVTILIAIDLPEWHAALAPVLLASFPYRLMRRAELIIRPVMCGPRDGFSGCGRADDLVGSLETGGHWTLTSIGPRRVSSQ